jgi:hypothetical protein
MNNDSSNSINLKFLNLFIGALRTGTRRGDQLPLFEEEGME